MSKRYTYSRAIKTIEGEETFTADQFDSFDEAIKIVDRGIADRRMDLSKRTAAIAPGAQIGRKTPEGLNTDVAGAANKSSSEPDPQKP